VVDIQAQLNLCAKLEKFNKVNKFNYSESLLNPTFRVVRNILSHEHHQASHLRKLITTYWCNGNELQFHELVAKLSEIYRHQWQVTNKY